MMKPTATEYDAITGETVEREMTDEELADYAAPEESEPKTT